MSAIYPLSGPYPYPYPYPYLAGYRLARDAGLRQEPDDEDDEEDDDSDEDEDDENDGNDGYSE